MTKRTDAHRPSAPEFDPQGYTLRGAYDLRPDHGNPAETARLTTMISSLEKLGFTFGGSRTGGCGHCGARIRYAALVTHEGTREMMFVGQTCLNGRFTFDKAEYDKWFNNLRRRNSKRLRDAAAAGRALKHMTGEKSRADKAAMIKRAVEAWAEWSPNEYALLTDENELAGSSFLRSLSEQLHQRGNLSPRQHDAVRDMAYRRAVKLEKQQREAAALARREAERQAEGSGLTEAGNGKTIVEGIVTRTKLDRTFDPDGILKMVVTTDGGFSVYATIPRALHFGDPLTESIGRRVRFTATVRTSPDNPRWQFASNPHRATWLD